MPTIPPTNLQTIRDLRGHGKGRTLVVVATGPSVNEIENLEGLAHADGIDTMAINRPRPELEPSDFLIYQDASTRQRLAPYLATYPGLVFCGFRASPGDQLCTVFFPLRQGMGFARDLTGGWFVGKSTTFAAAQLAIWMAYPRVFFLGVDKGAVGGKLWHYDGGNPDISRAERLPRFDVEARYWDHAAIALRPDERERFTFASSYNRYPFVDSFKRADHREIAGEILITREQS